MADERHLRLMLKYAQKAEQYCKGVSYADFLDDETLRELCVFSLAQLGEHAHRVSEDYVKAHPGLAWNEMYGLRNHIMHDYEGVTFELLWEVLTEDLPKLREQLEELFE